MKNLSSYQAKATDWRKQLKINDHRTYGVFIGFIIIYAIVGLLIDLYIHPFPEYMSLKDMVWSLLTLKTFPIATLVTSLVALVSILIAYAFYDKIVLLGTNYKQITLETATTLEEKQLYHVVEELQTAAGLRYLPKIYIIEAPYMNAFASGYSEKSALIAITKGLMQKLNRSELQAVMAHELNHIRHHDIKLTMAAAIMCNILLIAIDILFRGVIYGGRGRSRSDGKGGGNIIVLIIFLLRIFLPVITMILLLFLSRSREYMADAGAVELMRDNNPLANALLKINADHEQNYETYQKAYRETPHEEVRRAAYIFDPIGDAKLHAKKSMFNLFSTHPSIEARLKALGFVQKT